MRGYFFFSRRFYGICMLIGFVLGIIRKLEDGCLGEYGYEIMMFHGKF